LVSGKSTEFAFIETHLSPRFGLDTRHRGARRSRRDRRRPEFRDHPQDVGEELVRYGDLGHPEGDAARVTCNLRADLDQLLLRQFQTKTGLLTETTALPFLP